MTILERITLIAALLVAVVTWCSSASAVVIYDEAIDGDLPNAVALPVPIVATLVFGENEILGSIDGITDFDDAFNVALPANLQITSISVMITNCSFQTCLVTAATETEADFASVPPQSSFTFAPNFSFPVVAPQLFRVEEAAETVRWVITTQILVQPQVCGDGVVEPPAEECDDGGFVSNDGCDSSCVLEYCGDGFVQSGLAEECDDGDPSPADGCSMTCQLVFDVDIFGLADGGGIIQVDISGVTVSVFTVPGDSPLTLAAVLATAITVNPTLSGLGVTAEAFANRVYATEPFSAPLSTDAGIRVVLDAGTVLSEQKVSDTQGGFVGTLTDNDNFGSSGASLGDLDGDGVNDLAVGASGDDDGGTFRGAVWVLFLNADGTVKGDQKISDTEGAFSGSLGNFDEFGSSAASLGDLDGDGIDDLAVGASGDDDGGTNRGAVWILFLNADGTVKSEQKISDTEGAFSGSLVDDAEFGSSAASLGDLDGDGVDDLAVGAQAVGTLSSGGTVWVLFLNADGTVKDHVNTRVGGGFVGSVGAADNFGSSVASLGDLDGDGVDDLAVGAFGDNDGAAAAGAVWVLFLNADGTVKTQQKISNAEGWVIGLLSMFDNFGSSAASLGDLDGDGLDDLAVGAPGGDDGSPDGNRGEVWVLFLNADGTVKGDQKISDTEGGFTGALSNFDNFGFSAVSLGDLDGDGVNDLASGATGDNDGGANRGAVWMMNIEGDPQICGDGIRVGAEECDDGATVDGDGCSALCEVEGSFGLSGTAGGGFVQIEVEGNTIFVGTSAGQSAAQVTSNLAAAINATPTLQNLGITASATGGVLTTNGALGALTLSDTGLAVLEANLELRLGAVLFTDVDADGFADPGDTFAVTAEIENVGTLSATGVAYAAVVDVFTPIVPGSVVTDTGTVIVGNQQSTAQIRVEIGSLAPSSTAIVSYSLAVADPIPATKKFALVTGEAVYHAFQTAASDDPATVVDGDETVVGLGDFGILAVASQKLSDTQGELSGPGNPGGLLSDGDFLEIVEPIGDIDGDGIQDIALSTWSSTANDLYLAALDPEGTVKQRYDVPTPAGVVIGDSYGRCSAYLGDLDGPAGSDFAIAVGAPFDDGGGLDRGAVHVLFLMNDGSLVNSVEIADGGLGGFPGGTLSNSDYLGTCVESLGDLDGAGGAAAALAVGASAEDTAGSAAGTIWIVFLNANGTVFGSPVQITEGLGGFDGILKESGWSGPDFFGTSIEWLGDLDGDGNPEIAVGEDRDDAAGLDAGALWIFSLGANGQALPGAVKHEGGTDSRLASYSAAGTRFGNNRLGRISDLDGDGVPELLVRSNAGFALLYLDTDKSVKKVEAWSDALGPVPELQGATLWAAQEIGDLDGDFRPEITIAPGDALDDDGGADRGAVYVLYPTTSVPEPGVLLGLGSGIVMLGALARVRRSTKRRSPS